MRPRLPPDPESPLGVANAASADVVHAAIALQREFGPGLLENAYRVLLTDELRKRGREVEVEVPVALSRGGVHLAVAFRMDLLVDRHLVVELKAVERVTDAHLAQLLTYLRLARKPLGLLLNFNDVPMYTGIHRRINSRAENP